MYIDIHVHNYYEQENVILVQNLFPEHANSMVKKRYYSIGLHPWHVKDNMWQNDCEVVSRVSTHPNIIAIGETGLDAKVDISFETQVKAFRKQLEIAEECNKPVIIHCVRAYNEILSVRKHSNQNIPWIIHWFNASKQLADDLINKNCYLSFGHTLFKEDSKAFKAFTELPLDKIFFETDDAGISIIQVYEKGASIRKIKIDKLKTQLQKNFNNCFGKLL